MPPYYTPELENKELELQLESILKVSATDFKTHAKAISSFRCTLSGI